MPAWIQALGRWLTAREHPKDMPGWVFVGWVLWALGLLGLFLAYMHGTDRLDLPHSFGKVPVEAPWLGAIGGLVASLGGITGYSNGRWESRFNYWHVAKPLMGAASGSVACLLVIVIVRTAAGSTPPKLDSTALDAVAFVFGFAESSFRELIKAVTDTFLKPGAGAKKTKPEPEPKGAPSQANPDATRPQAPAVSPAAGGFPAKPAPRAMPGVTISVQNLADKIVSELDAEAIVAALDEQAKNDYNGSPWVIDGLATAIQQVVLVEKGASPPTDTWHLEILLNSDQPGALGYHEEQHEVMKGGAATDGLLRKASDHSSRGLREDNPTLPLMKIFAETATEDKASLAEVCSHEMLEAAVDPTPMKAPRTAPNAARQRIYIVEVGDPVQECGYDVNGQTVADFALPAWFGMAQSERPDQMSFRSSVAAPFQLAPGGYISWAPLDDPNNWRQELGS
jgi:hypothetical protein